MDDMKKAIAKHNAVGLMQIGYSAEEAFELALDMEEDMFPENWKRLKIAQPGYGAGSGGSSSSGSAYGPGGSHGAITG